MIEWNCTCRVLFLLYHFAVCSHHSPVGGMDVASTRSEPSESPSSSKSWLTKLPQCDGFRRFGTCKYAFDFFKTYFEYFLFILFFLRLYFQIIYVSLMNIRERYPNCRKKDFSIQAFLMFARCSYSKVCGQHICFE